MDGFRIRNTTNKDVNTTLLLELHRAQYFKELAETLTAEITQFLMHHGAKSPEFQAIAESNMAIVKWLIQIDNEAAAELERRASDNKQESAR